MGGVLESPFLSSFDPQRYKSNFSKAAPNFPSEKEGLTLRRSVPRARDPLRRSVPRAQDPLRVALARLEREKVAILVALVLERHALHLCDEVLELLVALAPWGAPEAVEELDAAEEQVWKPAG